jgi:hypothetical protein
MLSSLIDPSMIQVVILAACATFIVIYGSLFDRLRNLYLFTCPLCLGFWMGASLWALWCVYSVSPLDPVRVFTSGCLSAVCSFGLYRLLTIGD